jgi:molybdopterin-guanine dinucleotide biosynthesis protein A
MSPGATPVEKGLAEVHGVPLIERVIVALEGLAEKVVIVTSRPAPYSYLGLETIPDRFAGRGPLAGIDAALHFTGQPCFVAACDMPFVSAHLAAYMVSAPGEYDAVVPHYGGYWEPTFALYNPSATPFIRRALEAGTHTAARGARRAPHLCTAVHAVFRSIRVRPVTLREIRMFGDERALFSNVNEPSDLQSARGWVGARPLTPPARPRGAAPPSSLRS